jgi:hypothetical protein
MIAVLKVFDFCLCLNEFTSEFVAFPRRGRNVFWREKKV